MQIECIVYKGDNVDFFYNKFKQRLEQNVPMSVNFDTNNLLISGELKDVKKDEDKLIAIFTFDDKYKKYFKQDSKLCADISGSQSLKNGYIRSRLNGFQGKWSFKL